MLPTNESNIILRIIIFMQHYRRVGRWEARKHDVQGPVYLPTAFKAVAIGVNGETLGPSWKRYFSLDRRQFCKRFNVASWPSRHDLYGLVPT